jgi:hypothetical protein
VCSGPGPFALPPNRLSVVSMVSSSSSSSGGTSVAQGGKFVHIFSCNF